MPQNRFLTPDSNEQAEAPVNQPRRNRFLSDEEATDQPLASPITTTSDGGEDSGITPGKAAAGVVGLGGLAYLGSKMKNAPGVLGTIGKVASGANAVRQQLMLSGLALPKSVLGNVGATAEAAVERGSMEPLKQLFSKQTLSDVIDAWKRGGVASGTPGIDQGIEGGNAVTKLLSKFAPGRAMGAMDEATQGALRRSGLEAAEAEAAVLQRPLTPNIAEAFDNPAAKYLQPFRRTPINQVLEGGKKLTRLNRGEMNAGEKRALMLQMGGGAVHGAATADDDAPVSLPLGIAAASRGGLPYGLAAMVARMGVGGEIPGSGIAGSLLPASEWGLESSITDPTKPFRKPAALTALEKLGR